MPNRHRRYGVVRPPARHQDVRQVLESGPKYFADVIGLLGSKDGREIALALDELREQGILARLDNGEWTPRRIPRADKSPPLPPHTWGLCRPPEPPSGGELITAASGGNLGSIWHCG
jgi:hypothetical protein